MFERPKIATTSPPGHRLRSLLSLLSLGLALTLLAGTYFLMSPPTGASYPGAIPYRPGSILRHITDLMALHGSVPTVRGVEIKDFAFHLATVAALVLLAARALVSGLLPPDRRTAKGAWFVGQAFLAGWVLLSLASSRWSGAPDLSWGQAALYGLALAWAVALGWSLESRDVPRLLWGYVIIAATGATLCVWYFHERNPYHNPGFPIGNPNMLAACTMPAILIAAAVLVGSVWTSVHEGHSLLRPRAIAAGVLLIPLCWCFKLADSLAALIGLIAGVAGVLFLRAGRRIRWTILIALLAAGGLGALYVRYAQHDFVQDFAMSRGPTIRFRVYAWRYAAVLWSQRPISGIGAGQYPRLAGALSVGDRMLDPAAFMGEMVEHAHNELFEVFAEIGLVGGVTLVAGFLATLAAAAALLRTSLSPERRWLLFGLVAAVIALMADAMFGVGLRLPGVPAVCYTLLGALWAVCRSISKQRFVEREVTETWLRRMVVRRYGLTAVSLVLAITAGWLALRNWSGARHEQAADVAYRNGDYRAGLTDARAAEMRLLDPVRKLIASKRAVDCQFARAYVAFTQATAAYEQHPAAHSEDEDVANQGAELRTRLLAAGELCRSAYEAALNLSQRTPNFGRMAALGAQCAEMLVALCNYADDREQAADWNMRALRAWQSQRFLRPYDVQTLLKLVGYVKHYRGLTGEYVGLLRDALRGGFPPAEWYDALRDGPELRDFPRTLAALLQSVGPYDPQTDLDALILSGAPEMYRLSAAWKALQGAYESAAADAARAALLYRPMRARFPELYSVALAEQAEYGFQAQPGEPRRAIALLREAIHALPMVQKQKYEALVEPYRLRLARFLLAADEQNEAADNLRAVLEQQPDNVGAWVLMILLATEQGDAETVQAALRDAEQAGLREADLDTLRGIVRQRMPELFETRERE